MAVLIPLALLDLLAAAVMLLQHFDFISGKPAFPFAVYLIAKGIAFQDIGSFGDMAAGLYMVGMIALDFQSFLAYFFVIYLVQKALLSFAAF